MHKTPMQQALQTLLDQGNLEAMLVSLMEKRRYKPIADMLTAYKYVINDQAGHGEDKKSRENDSLKRAFDTMQSVSEKLDDAQRPVFLALTFGSLTHNSSLFTFSPSEFRKEFMRESLGDKYKNRYQAEYDTLGGHPFVVGLRDTLRYSTQADALGMLTTQWEKGDKDGFLFLYDALAPMQRRQNNDESLNDRIATHPGLEFVILGVPRGNKLGNNLDQSELPPLRILVSNKPRPVDYAPPVEAGVSKEGWGNVQDPEFYMLTAAGTFTDLKSYMRASLKDRTESIGHGPYSYSSNDDRSYPTAANAMATIQNFLRVPSNFEAPAQERLREQVSSVETTAFAPIYMNRFLRAQGLSDWSAALCFAENRDRRMLEHIDIHDAAKTLVTHGFTNAVDFMEFSLDGDYDSEVKAMHGGYLAGMQQLHADMQELSRPGESSPENGALDRFERTRGFHPDVMLFPVSERKRLAFQDLSDIAVAHLNGHLMMEMQFADKKADAQKDLRDAETVKAQTFEQVPLEGIFDLMVQAGDVTNFMRVYEHQRLIGGKGDDNTGQSPLAKKLGNTIEQAGYYVSPDRMAITRFNKLEFRAVIGQEGDVMVRTKAMARFKTPEQIITDGNLVEALCAREVISGFTFPENLREKQEQQTQALTDFIEQKVMARDFREEIAKIPEAERAFYTACMREMLPHAVGLIAAEDKLPDVETDRQKRIAAHAFDDATGMKPKAKFAGVVKALSAVSGLWKSRL